MIQSASSGLMGMTASLGWRRRGDAANDSPDRIAVRERDWENERTGRKSQVNQAGSALVGSG